MSRLETEHRNLKAQYAQESPYVAAQAKIDQEIRIALRKHQMDRAGRRIAKLNHHGHVWGTDNTCLNCGISKGRYFLSEVPLVCKAKPA